MIWKNMLVLAPIIAAVIANEKSKKNVFDGFGPAIKHGDYQKWYEDTNSHITWTSTKWFFIGVLVGAVIAEQILQ